MKAAKTSTRTSRGSPGTALSSTGHCAAGPAMVQ
jgi:hypothetical protein